MKSLYYYFLGLVIFVMLAEGQVIPVPMQSLTEAQKSGVTTWWSKLTPAQQVAIMKKEETAQKTERFRREHPTARPGAIKQYREKVAGRNTTTNMSKTNTNS